MDDMIVLGNNNSKNFWVLTNLKVPNKVTNIGNFKYAITTNYLSVRVKSVKCVIFFGSIYPFPDIYDCFNRVCCVGNLYLLNERSKNINVKFVIIIIMKISIIIINIISAIELSHGGCGYFTCIQNIKLVTNKFKSGGLHEKHVVATWNLGNHLSICF